MLLYTHILLCIKGNFNKKINIYPLWIAHYVVSTPDNNGIWDNWIGFQYSESGSVRGIPGKVDLDEFTSGILLKDNDSFNEKSININNKIL